MMLRRTYAAAALIGALTALPSAAWADDSAPDPAPADDGFSLIEEGAKLLLRGLTQEMEPALKDLAEGAEALQPVLRDWALQLGPMLRDLAQAAGDLSHYDAPEVLPNGDILLRRKPNAPPIAPLDPPEDGEIDL